MPTMPIAIMLILHQFAPVFSERIWDWAQVLVVGAILAPHKRTVTSVLRIMGLSGERQFQNYHRVLNRARWSGLEASQILLGLLVAAFVPAGSPLVLAADETLERRRGKSIGAKGHFRDPVLSSEKHNIASEGLRWVSMMLLVPLPWSKRVWALPFLTVLAPHEKSHLAQGKRHKTSIDWVQQMTSQVRRWLPQRPLVLVTDGGLIAVRLGLRCNRYKQPATFVSRLHLNIRLFAPPAPSRRKNASRVGSRVDKLDKRLNDPNTPWTRETVAWYGGKRRLVEWVSDTALWQTPSEKSRRCPFAGYWCAIPFTNSKPPLSAARIWQSVLNKLLPGMSCAGMSKLPLRMRALILAWKPNASGVIWQLLAPPPAFWLCMPWSFCWLIISPPRTLYPRARQLGTPNLNLPLWMLLLWFVVTCGNNFNSPIPSPIPDLSLFPFPFLRPSWRLYVMPPDFG